MMIPGFYTVVNIFPADLLLMRYQLPELQVRSIWLDLFFTLEIEKPERMTEELPGSPKKAK